MKTLIHEMSSTVPLPKFDIFGVPPTQGIVEKDIITEHRPITTIDPSSFVQFEIFTAADEYLDLEKLFLYMKVQVKRDANIKDDDWGDIGPVNYAMHAIIKQMDIFIGDKQVTNTSPNYAYKAYIEALFGYPSSAKKSYLDAAGWFLDEEENKKNNDFNQRGQTYISKYGSQDYYGRLHTDLAFQGRNLLGGCKVTIRLLFNEPKFYLMSMFHTPVLEFLDICLFAHRSKVPQEVVKAHEAALKISTAKYPITMAKVKSFTITKGSMQANIDHIHSGQLPRRIFVCFVDNLAYIGDYKKNPFWFYHYKINCLTVTRDGEQWPPKAYTPNFQGSNFVREYMSLYEALDMLDGESTLAITRDNYPQGNVLFGFNFAPDLSIGSGATGYLNPIKFGTLGLNVQFAEPISASVTVLVYCEFDKLLEIDINRNAFLDTF